MTKKLKSLKVKKMMPKYNPNAEEGFDQNVAENFKFNYWKTLFQIDKTKVGILAATPLISSIDCAMTYPAAATVGLMQSQYKKFLPAFKIQIKQTNGIYHGWLGFWKAKNKSRITGLMLGSSIIGNQPSLFNINIAAIISAFSETVFTNTDICKSRLQVINKVKHIDPYLLKLCSRATFSTHLFKNVLTLYVALGIFNLTPQEYIDKSPLSDSATRGVLTGAGVMALQLLGAAQLDTAMTHIMKEKYHHPTTHIDTTRIVKNTMRQSVKRNLGIAGARASIFGLSYATTFTIIGEIKGFVNDHPKSN